MAHKTNKNDSSNDESNIINNKEVKNNDNLTNDKSLLKAKDNAFMRFFGIRKYNTTIAKEIIGGLATFLAAVYILTVEPSIITDSMNNSITNDALKSQWYGTLFLTTVLVTALFTALMGVFANVPIILAPAMGMNAVFAYNVASSIGYQEGCIATMFSGLLLLIISSTKIRIIIINSIPKSLKTSISAGIGFLLTYIGFKEIGLFSMDSNTNLPIASLSTLKETYPTVLIGLGVFFLCIVLHFRNIIGSTIISILSMFIISVIIVNSTNSDLLNNSSLGSAKWTGWNYEGYSYFGENIKGIFKTFNSSMWTHPTFYEGIFMFLMLAFFDASSTIDAACNATFESRECEYERSTLIKAMIVDSSSSLVGGVVGLSPNTALSETFVGIKQGAKTGVASLMISALVLCAIPLYPLFKMIPVCVTGGATAFIGILIAGQIKDVDWSVPEYHVSAVMTILITVVTYNITNGVAMGMISYVIVCATTKKIKQIKPVLWVLILLFVAYFIVYALL